MISFSVHKLSVYGLVHKDSKTAACQFWVLLQNKRQNLRRVLNVTPWSQSRQTGQINCKHGRMQVKDVTKLCQ
jgi:hypothetical protein